MFANTGIDLLSLDIMSPTIEAVTLNAISGILAQLLTAYKAQVTKRSQYKGTRARLTICRICSK
jgi:energy-converting hydrogenase Eha subunit A